MAISRLLDLTDQFNQVAVPSQVVDMSEWDYAIVQATLPGATISVSATCDPGAITGTTQGNALLATNYIAVPGTNINSGASVSIITGSSMVKFSGVGKFLKLTSPGTAAFGGVFVFLFKTY